MAKTPHTHFPRGAHVFVILRSGEKFEDQFWGNEGHGEIRLKDHGWVRIKKIRSIGYRKLNA